MRVLSRWNSLSRDYEDGDKKVCVFIRANLLCEQICSITNYLISTQRDGACYAKFKGLYVVVPVSAKSKTWRVRPCGL